MEILERSGNGAARRCMAPTSVRRAAHLLWLTLVACGHAQNVAPAPTSAETPIAKPAPVTPLVSLTVLPVVSKNLDPGVVGMVTSVLTAEVHAVPGYSVITVDDLNARLTLEKQKDLLSCSEEKCMTEIGGALGVARILSSSAGAIGETLVLQLTLIQTNDGKILGRIYESATGPVDVLIPITRRAVHKLFELPGDPPEIPKQGEPIARPRTASPAPTQPRTRESAYAKTGGLNLDSVSPGTSVRVLGPAGFRFEGTLPWLAAALAPGEYALHLTGPGRADKDMRVHVKAGELAAVIVQLEKASAVPAEATDEPSAKLRTEAAIPVEQPPSDAPPAVLPQNRAASNPSRPQWLRCPVGQTAAGPSCKGKARVLNWESAQNACPTGYRIASSEDLLALLDCDSDSFHPGNCQPCGQSAACKRLFGDDRASYWTSGTQGDDGIVVGLHVGIAEPEGKDFGHAVRCVKP